MAGSAERTSNSSVQKHREPLGDDEPLDMDHSQLPSADKRMEPEDDGHDQTGYMTETVPAAEKYVELMRRKKFYKTAAQEQSQLARSLEQENSELRHRLDLMACQQDALHESRHINGAGTTAIEHENAILKSHLIVAKEFLKIFNVQDFAQAQREWYKEKEELEQTREQFSKLQNEVLSCVDRFDPSFDSQVSQGFVRLNQAIGKLIKSKDLKQMVLRGNPLSDWDANALWDDSVNLSVVTGSPSDMEKKLLLRQAIWKFISERLLDRAQPLASFGGAIGELASRFCFDKLFPDHETNENAGKWRSITVRQLNLLQEVDDSGRDKKDFLKNILAEFAAYINENLTRGQARQEQLDSMLGKGDLDKRLHEVFDRAVEFSRLIMQERAGFTIESPHLKGMKCKRGEDDQSTTAYGVTVGVNDGPDAEGDRAGIIELVGSPMLIKHGDGGGKNLDQTMVIVKAFVLISA